MNHNQNQKGLIDVFILILLVLLVLGTGYIIYKVNTANTGENINNNESNAEQTTQNSQTEDAAEPSRYSQFSSTSPILSFYYPKDWIIEEITDLSGAYTDETKPDRVVEINSDINMNFFTENDATVVWGIVSNAYCKLDQNGETWKAFSSWGNIDVNHETCHNPEHVTLDDQKYDAFSGGALGRAIYGIYVPFNPVGGAAFTHGVAIEEGTSESKANNLTAKMKEELKEIVEQFIQANPSLVAR